GFEMKTIACRYGRVVFHDKPPHHITFFRFRAIGVQCTDLMAQSDTRYFARMTSPGGNGFKVIQYDIILVDGHTVDFLDKFPDGRTHKRFPEIDAPGLTKNKTQPMEPVFYRKRKINIGLYTTDEYIDLTELLQAGNNIHCPAQVAVSSALYGIKYLHI